MSTAIETSNVKRMAEMLQRDIRRRSLMPGDRYLTGAEAGKLLGVSTAMAQRAMMMLSEDGWLVRRPSQGTFVGPAGAQGDQNANIRSIHVLYREDDPQLGFGLLDHVISGIRQVLPGTNIQLDFIPPRDSASYTRELLRKAQQAGNLAGLVAISCPREVYRIAADSGLPMVVFGTLYTDHPNIPSIDLDNREAGRLLAQYLVDRGHRRIALVASLDGRPGDHQFLDGVSEVLTKQQLPHNALIVRVFSPGSQYAHLPARELLEASDRPTAIIARSHALADTVFNTASDLGLSVPKDLEIVVQNFPPLPWQQSISYPCVQAHTTYRNIVAKIAQILDDIGHGKTPEPLHTTIPVEMHVDPKN